MGSVEQVLVFPRSLLPRFVGVRSYDPVLWDKIRKNAVFMNRKEAEVSTVYKQIIPYSLVQVGDKFLSYRRTSKGKEGRLVGLRSLGIGGHINPVDRERADIVVGSLIREFEEELGLVVHEEMFSLIGFLNDDETPVGFVHFGVLFLVRMDKCELGELEGSISEVEFIRPEEISSHLEEYETWSKLAFEFIVSSLWRRCGKGS